MKVREDRRFLKPDLMYKILCLRLTGEVCFNSMFRVVFYRFSQYFNRDSLGFMIPVKISGLGINIFLSEDPCMLQKSGMTFLISGEVEFSSTKS